MPIKYIPAKRKTKATEVGNWSEAKKMEAFMTWMATGNLPQTAAITKIPLETIRAWRYRTEWWKQEMERFRDDDKQELDVKYQKIVRKALTVMDDRLTNGNFQLDQKTGRILRVPVSLADSHRVMKDLVDQQQVLRKDTVEEQKQATESVNDKLIKLAQHFAEMAAGKVVKDVNPGNTYEMEQIAIETIRETEDNAQQA